jgi:hypothetical protein
VYVTQTEIVVVGAEEQCFLASSRVYALKDPLVRQRNFRKLPGWVESIAA